jgi:MFS transporter, PAT family, solute carrier family 33 (acetyl-CoA transportor), member 1
MTLLNTVTNLGQVWMKTIFLWLMDVSTWKSCIFNESSNFTLDLSSFCYDNSLKDQCTENGGICETVFDGFYLEIAVGIIFSFFWFYFGGKLIAKLQNLPLKSWHVLSSQTENQENVVLKRSSLKL